MDKIVKHGVLIADPQPNMASLIAATMRGIGHRMVTEVTSLRELEASLANRSFSLVVMDDQLGHTAIDFVRQVRGDIGHANRTTAIIMMSAAPSAQTIAEARDAGVSEFLRKPFSAADLQKRIAGLDLMPRDFVVAPEYAGPDRRRKILAIAEEEDQRG